MIEGTAKSYRVFVRNWWRWEYNDSGEAPPRRLVPNPGARKTSLARHMTEGEARALCHEYNTTHNPGPLSRKAEYERE